MTLTDGHHDTPTTSLDVAISYARRGWRVIPIPSGEKFPNGARVGHKTCTECGGRVVETHAYEEVALMRDPPHQVERFQRHTRWQCMNVEKHHGEYSAAAETRGGLAAWEIAEGA